MFAVLFCAGMAMMLTSANPGINWLDAVVHVLLRRLVGIGAIGGSFVYLALAWYLHRN